MLLRGAGRFMCLYLPQYLIEQLRGKALYPQWNRTSGCFVHELFLVVSLLFQLQSRVGDKYRPPNYEADSLWQARIGGMVHLAEDGQRAAIGSL